MFFFTNKQKESVFSSESIEHAYLAILNEDLNTAKMIFKQIDSPRAIWGRSLIEILEGCIINFPTYFGIRNFLEIDLDFLLKNEKISYVEQILGALDILVNINQEVYKYTARVMFENRLFKASREYLEKSKKEFYNDPELHFLYAKYYIKTRDYENADLHLDSCLKILPEYFPAKQLQKEISRYLA